MTRAPKILIDQYQLHTLYDPLCGFHSLLLIESRAKPITMVRKSQVEYRLQKQL